MSKKIETSGQIREFLIGIMVGVKEGHVGINEASRITKLAAQVNESLYAEIKIAKVHLEAGKQAAGFGDLPLGTVKPDQGAS